MYLFFCWFCLWCQLTATGQLFCLALKPGIGFIGRIIVYGMAITVNISQARIRIGKSRHVRIFRYVPYGVLIQAECCCLCLLAGVEGTFKMRAIL